MRETQVHFLGWEDPLEKELAARLQYSCLENPVDGWRSQLDYSPWCRKESDMTERLHFHFTSIEIQSREGGYTPASTHLKPEFCSGHLQLRDV